MRKPPAVALLAALALATGCGFAPPQVLRRAEDARACAARRARPVLARYGIAGVQLRLPSAAVRARERASDVAFERALALALEAFIADRDSAAALARAAGPDSGCPRDRSLQAMTCYLRKDGSHIALMSPKAAALPEGDVEYLFAVTIPDRSQAPFRIAVVVTPSGDAIAAPVRDAPRRDRPARAALETRSECASARVC